MNRIVLITSHLASGSSELIKILNKNERIQVSESNIIYEGISDLESLKSNKHKLNNSAAIFGDHILFNINFSNKSLYSCLKFIYCIRSGTDTMNELISKYHYTPETGFNYYCFRLRRLYEMAHQTPGAVFLTWNNLADGKGLDLIDQYLELKEPLLSEPDLFIKNKDDDVPYIIRQQAEDYYEQYFYLFNQLNLKLIRN
jgi:hypothetical protein